MSRGDYPAYPARVFELIGDNTDHGGLTLREHYAGMAMQGLLANPLGRKGVNPADEMARVAIACADALPKELAGEPEGVE